MEKIIGRKKENETLKKFLRELKNGKGNIVFIAGEAGIGKSFLVREFFNHKEISIYTSTAYDEDDNSYSLIAAILRQIIRKNNPGKYDAGPLTKYLSAIIPEIVNHTEDVSNETLHESVIQAIEQIGLNAPSIIVFDDFHRADKSTLDIIPMLAERIKNIPLLILCIYRSEEISTEHGLRKVRDTLRRLSLLNEIILESLSYEETGNMIQEIITHSPGEEFLKSVFDFTQGIPFYIEEIAGSIDVNKLNASIENKNNTNYHLSIPQVIKDSVIERIKTLSTNAVEILEAASLTGNDFEIDFILRINNDEKSLNELFEKKYLVETNKGKAAFRHILVKEVIRQGTGWLKRRQYHKKIAELLSTLNSDYKQITEHWLSAGDYNKSIEWSAKYVESLVQKREYKEAVSESYKALQIKTDNSSDEFRIKLLKAYALSTQLTGSLDESKKANEEIIEHGKTNSDFKLLGETYRELASVYSLQNSHNDSLTNRVLSAENFETAGLPDEAVQEYYVAARKNTSMLHIENAIVFAEKSVKLSSGMENNPVKAKALGLYGNLLAMKGEAEKGRKLVQDALDIAISINDTDASSENYRRLASALEYQSDYISARNAYLNAYDFCINTGKETNAQVCLSCMSYIFFQTGEWNKSIEICRKVIYGKHTPETSVPVGYGMTGLIQAFRGETKSAIKSLKKALEYSVKYNTVAIELYIYWGLAVVYENEMDDKAVVENFKMFLNRWQTTQEMHDIIPPLMWASIFFSERGMKKELSGNLEILGRVSSVTGNIEAMAALEFVIGESELLNEKYDEAVKHFNQSLIHHANLSIPLAKLLIEFRLGITLLKKEETEEALKYLNSSLRCAKNLGAKPLAAKIKRTAESSGGYIAESRDPESSERLNKAGLTARQLKVLELMSEGLINKEIADKLFISSRTVDMHVSNVLQRLNCKTRTEAITKANESGII